MDSLWIEYDDETIVGRWEYRDATWNRCVKGAIEAPIQCNCAVYYNARFTEHPGGYVIVDGVAGLDSGYCGGEGGQFRWILKNAEGMPEGMLVVGDWHNRESVPADVIARYVDKVFYEREGQVVAAVVTEDSHHDRGCFPYYRYSRTKEGPKIPELVGHVLGHMPAIVFASRRQDMAEEEIPELLEHMLGQMPAIVCHRYRGVCAQRLELLVAVMLARERLLPADTAADGCTELAAALAALPSRPLEMVADALAALGGGAVPAAILEPTPD